MPPQMIEDAELLRRYVNDRSQAAFAALVERNLNLVYFSALRRTDGDGSLAEDVTQQVFANLAQSAAAVAHHPVLSGWLYVATRNAAANAMRTERRRKTREQEAYAMQDPAFSSRPETDWDQLRPRLDSALDELGEGEREAVLLRCLQDRPFSEIGKLLQITDEAARKRVDRALEKLRGLLAARGITSTSAALAFALTDQGAVAAPAGLAVRVIGRAWTAVPAGSAAGIGTFTLMSSTKIAVATVGLIIIAAAGWLAFEPRTPAPLPPDAASVQPSRTKTTASATVPAASRQPETGPTIPTLRNEKAAVRDSTRAIPPPARNLVGAGPVPSTEWANRGTATPAEALETGFWAFDHFDPEVLATTLCFGDEQRDADAFFATLPEAVREKYPTPEQLMATLLAATAGGPRLTTIDVPSVRENTSRFPPTAAVHLRSQRENDVREEGDIVFMQTADGWRRIVPAKWFVSLANNKFPPNPKPAAAK